MVKKNYIHYTKDKGFRKWLEKEKNIVPAYLFAFGTRGTITSYRKEFNCLKKLGKVL